MNNSTKNNLTTRKSLLIKVKALKKKTILSLAGIFLIASGGYYEVKKLPLIEILYVEEGDEQFLALIENSEKKGLILFYTDYCFPCEKMNDLFRRNVKLASLVNHAFVPFKVDAFDKETGAVLREKYNIDHFPTLIVTNHNGIEIDRIDDSGVDVDLIDKLSTYSNHLPPSQGTEILKTSFDNEQKDFYVEKKVEYVGELTEDSQKPSLSLSLEVFDSYSHARSSALLKTKLWKNEIWIEEVEKGTYRLMLGQFEEEREVILAQNYLKSWEGMESEVHELNVNPQQYK